MRIKRGVFQAAAIAALLSPMAAAGQNSSVNTFSPYTFYGIGELQTLGTADIRSMGGAGIAYRSTGKINYLNPAAATSGMRQSFLLNFGMEGQNHYLRSGETSSSYNSFNIRDIAIQFPLSSRFGVSMSVTPFSSVGYRISKAETDPEIVDDLKSITYTYQGSGGITQVKAGLGYSVTRRLSVGAEMVYYLGNIERSAYTQIISYTGETQSNSSLAETNRVSRVFANAGIQYNAIMNTKRILTIGATYQPGGNLNPKVRRQIGSNNIGGDIVYDDSRLSDFRMADMITAGLSYQTHKAVLNADYSFRGWGDNADSDLSNSGVAYRNTNSVKLGGEYTPNRLDVRHFRNRLTYRAGVRYSDYYMSFDGHNISERSVAVGVGIPMRMGSMSAINVGLEVGARGTTRNNLIRENFVKISIGLNLFGEDYWFVKPKYD